jgi:hypothetical protein
MVEPQARVARPAHTFVVPERVDPLVRIFLAQRVGPALAQKFFERRAAFGLDQRVVVVGFRRIDVELGRRDVVVAGKHDRRAGLSQRGRVFVQPRVPGELVVEFRAGLGIAVRRVEGGDEHAVDGGLDVARLVSVASPGSAVRVRIGSTPRARMATPFQVRWPCHTAW